MIKATTEATTLPLNQLMHDTANAGDERRLTQIDDLLASIPEHGIIQSLLVRPIKYPGKGDKMHAVMGGGRRLAALQKLAADGRIKPDYAVPVIIRKSDDATAHELSTAENIQRLPMSPVEEFRAFARMRADGRGDEEIALHFGIPVRRVQQRARLAELHPDVLQALTDRVISLEAAQAYTIQPNPELQRAHLKAALDQNLRWQLQAGQVKQAMANLQVAADSKQAEMIGEAAYLAAGGEIVSDLFGDDVYWVSGDIIKALSAAAWEKRVADWQAEGWGFVAPADEYGTDKYGWSNARNLKRIDPGRLANSDEEQKQLADLQDKLEEVQAPWEDADEDDIPAETVAEVERLEREISLLEKRTWGFTAAQKAQSGVVYYLDGAAEPIFGAIDGSKVAGPGETDEEKKAAKAAAKATPPNLETDAGDIVRDLCDTWITAGLQAKVGGDPVLALQVGVAALHAQMRTHTRPPLHLAGTSMGRGDDGPPPQGNSFETALAWAKAQTQDDLLIYFAQLVAVNINCRWNGPAGQGGGAVRLLLDFADPDLLPQFDAAAYFDGLRKPAIAFAYELMTGLKLKDGKKGEMVATAAARAKELGWLPPQLRTPSYVDKGVTPAPATVEPTPPEEQLQAAE